MKNSQALFLGLFAALAGCYSSSDPCGDGGDVGCDGAVADAGPPTFACVVTSVQTDATGEVSVARVSYDDEGSVQLIELDYDADGVVDTLRYLYSYETDGRVRSVEYEGGRWSYAYDPAGNLQTLEWSELDDGTWTLALTHTYAYDADGNLSLREWNEREGEERLTYDGEGNLLTCEWAIGSGWGGRRTYAHDTDGNLVNLLFEDLTGTGGFPERSTMTYDSGGNRLTQTSFSRGPGFESGERRTAWTYDSGGNVLTRVVTEPDGRIDDTTWTYECDSPVADRLRVPGHQGWRSWPRFQPLYACPEG